MSWHKTTRPPADSLQRRCEPVRLVPRLAALVGALSSLAPALSFAQGAPVDHGLQLGARIGYSLPTGTLAGGSPSTHISDLETAAVPLGIDLGYRFAPTFYLGGTLAWGPGIAPNAQGSCPVTASCSREDTQIRVEARVYFAPEAQVGWWMAFGAGWEIADFSQSAGTSSVVARLTGPILADIQLGFESRKGLGRIGPYLGVTFAEFLTEDFNPPTSGSIQDPGVHEWITVGLRGSYGPW